MLSGPCQVRSLTFARSLHLSRCLHTLHAKRALALVRVTLTGRGKRLNGDNARPRLKFLSLSLRSSRPGKVAARAARRDDETV